MSVLLDTSVLIDILRGHQPALAYVEDLSDEPVCSEISRIEVIQGLRGNERTVCERLFAQLHWLPVDEPVARVAGELGAAWRGSHPGIGIADLAIAATVAQAGADLATANVKHFPMIEGLKPPYA